MDQTSDDLDSESDSSLSDDDDVMPNLDSSNMDLQFDIEVQCPLELAPIEYIEKFVSPDLESRYSHLMKSVDSRLSTTNYECKFFLQMNVQCPTSYRSRLPSSFQWLIKSNDFDETIGSMP